MCTVFILSAPLPLKRSRVPSCCHRREHTLVPQTMLSVHLIPAESIFISYRRCGESCTRHRERGSRETERVRKLSQSETVQCSSGCNCAGCTHCEYHCKRCRCRGISLRADSVGSDTERHADNDRRRTGYNGIPQTESSVLRGELQRRSFACSSSKRKASAKCGMLTMRE